MTEYDYWSFFQLEKQTMVSEYNNHT